MSDQEPDDLSEDIKKLEERKDYYEQWLKGIRKAQEVVPIVGQNIETTDWQIRALQNRPEEASEIPYPSNPYLLEKENEYLRRLFPPIVLPSGHCTSSEHLRQKLAFAKRHFPDPKSLYFHCQRLQIL